MKYTDENLDNKKILITGGAGFIGSNLAMYFQKFHPNAEVIVFDRFRSEETFSNGNFKSLGHFKNLLDFNGEVIVGDITNKDDLARIDKIKFDYIFHEAAISDTTVMDQDVILRANVNAYKDLLEMSLRHGAKMIYASSAGTYGNTQAPNIVGKGEIPENVYGFSKLCMDKLTYKFLKENPTHIIGLRYFNVYGENELYKGKTASMILQLGIQALKNKKVRLFKMGEQKRDFVYVQDVVMANIKAISGKSGIYNVGSGESRSFNDIVKCLQNEFGEFEVEYFDNPYKFFQNHTHADIEPTKEALGYNPQYKLEDGIKKYAKSIKEIADKGEF